MAAKPVRLLHAANLQLDCPLRGVGSLNDDVREIADAATLTAFDRLVTASIDKDIDALLITGNTFDAAYGSLAAEVAMRDGFARLDERGIPIIVTPGVLDPSPAWAEMPRLPDNVTVFLDVEDSPIDLMDRGQLLATLFPVAADTAIEPEELANILGGRKNSKGDRPFVVGMYMSDRSDERPCHFQALPTQFAALDWLACPAGIDKDSLPLTDGHIHAQTGPQGLSILETGIRGATLLEVDSHRKTRRTTIPLAPVRWERIVQSVDHAKGRDDLLESMLAQIERLPHAKGELVRIIDWTLDRTTADAHGWQSEAVASELAESLTELSDAPDGLRYIHRVHSLPPDLTVIEPGHREVLTEFLLALERKSPADRSLVTKWIADARVGDLLKGERWETWTESISPAQVSERAQQLGWKWFATVGKK